MCYATGSVPCSDECDEAGRCLLSSESERAMNNEIITRSNGDFEVIPEKQTKIMPRTHSELPQQVFWLVNGKWEHKGWLMPRWRNHRHEGQNQP